ncbi:MEDS domain-containing protein [Roseateles amylovorans]|uniref:MEDS domain-containing protein n=1 Tax=Roseateles amylovorans TaxID=2978473 RepID=A0ABY6AUA1_9BURK|nr:MEDS domain-containing protein [Roseateles amylovorans]UXH76247.1 MEDS domain-containing protein [Roseateles amylovorans]
MTGMDGVPQVDWESDPVDGGRMDLGHDAAMWLAGSRLTHFHVCAFFNSREEEDQVLGPFHLDAARQGEQLLHLLAADQKDVHRAHLSDAGLATSHCEACGQLELRDWRTVCFDDEGDFDKQRLLESIDHWTGPARDVGFPRVRLMARMGQLLQAAPDKADVMEYEAEVNDILARHRQPAVCVYDIATLDGATMMDLLRTHPLTLIAGVLRENPFYTPPAEMLRELAARRGSRGGRHAGHRETRTGALRALR